MIDKFKDFVSKKAKAIGDFFSIMCPKCNTRMKKEFYIPGIPDSVYWECPKCKHKIDATIDESLRDTFRDMKKRFKEYRDFQNTEEPETVSYPTDIKLDTDFDNKLSMEDRAIIERDSVHVKYTQNETNKLNLFFGTANPNEFHVGKYFFSVRNQRFGQPTHRFYGTIDKKKMVETKDIVYLLDMSIQVKTKESMGKDWVTLKYDRLDGVLEFLDTIIEK